MLVRDCQVRLMIAAAPLSRIGSSGSVCTVVTVLSELADVDE